MNFLQNWWQQMRSLPERIYLFICYGPDDDG